MPKNKDSKENIIKTSFALFLQKGYKEVTIINIMEATKLSKGAIYHYFKSKEEIYYATLDTYYFNLLQTDNLNLSTGNFRQDIHFLCGYAASLFHNIENLKEEGLDYPIRNFFSYQLESEKNETIRKKIFETVSDYKDGIKILVGAACDRGQIKKELDVDTVTLQIIALLEGTAIHHSTVKRNVKKILLEKYEMIFKPFLDQICTE